jgi:hypothetical protein
LSNGELRRLMADDIDKANDQVQKTLDSTLRAMRKNSGEPPKTLTGKCIWCEEPIRDNRRWCSAECRDTYTESEADNKWNR